MLPRILRSLGGAVWLSLLALVLPFSFSSVEAQILTVSQPTDFWVEVTEPSVLQARAYAQEVGIDSHLWLYASDGTLIVANDDWYGLDSWIEFPVEPGSYRLRAGICCGNPDAWYGGSYTVDLNFDPTEPTTTTSTTTTVPETTTTTEPPETTTSPPTTESTTTTTTTSTTVVEPTVPATTVPPETIPATTTEAPQPPIVIPPSPEPEPEPEPTVPTVPAPEEPVESPETVAPTSPEPTPETESSVPEKPVEEPIEEPEEQETESSAPSDPESEPEPEEPAAEPVREVTEILADLTSITASDLSTISDADLDVLLDSIDNNGLTDEAAEAIALAMSQAPDQVKAQFESEINIFGGQFDSYVPLGSVISVGERRTVVAVSVGVAVPAAAAARRRSL